jgi:hypothetical protein
VDLKAIVAVRKPQRNPELGGLRAHAALKQLGMHLNPRTRGRILALDRKPLNDLEGKSSELRLLSFAVSLNLRE